jgi:hypothetical protein
MEGYQPGKRYDKTVLDRTVKGDGIRYMHFMQADRDRGEEMNGVTGRVIDFLFGPNELKRVLMVSINKEGSFLAGRSG